MSLARATAAGAALLATAGAAAAIEEGKGDKAALKACEKSLCQLVTRKGPPEGDLTCALAKTWRKAELKQGSATGRMSWGFGDARCKVDLKLARATIVTALKEPKSKLLFPEHTVDCVVEGDKKVETIKAILAPKAQIEDGKVTKVWINLRKVEGPAMMKGLAIATAKVEDKVGIFHGALVKAINGLIHERCPQVVAGK
jgi:hypothetical protein